MKHLFLSLLLGGVALTATAQQALNDIRKNVHVSASNTLAYPGPLKPQTPAPKGEKPFYLSHYGRHGSRYLIGPQEYLHPVEVLQKADSLGKLSALGKDVLGRLILIRNEADGRLGELTELGAEQHRQIARRMFERFPEVFEGEANVDAKSTVVIRCILSMENALQQLVALNPQLHVTHDASEHDMYYMNQHDPKLNAQKMDSTVQARFGEYAQRCSPGYRMVYSLFNDQDYVDANVDRSRLNGEIFNLASNVQSTELRKRLTLYDLFTDEELYHNWQSGNAWWYINFGPSALNGGTQPYSQRNLLRRIIEQADSCIRLSKPGATLRYGHDTMVMPLAALLDLDGYGMSTNNLDQLERRGWLNYRIFPMAANIQFVFYRKHQDDPDVLVKVLLNENEATLPLKSRMAPYYKWSDFREYYLKKLDAYEHE